MYAYSSFDYSEQRGMSYSTHPVVESGRKADVHNGPRGVVRTAQEEAENDARYGPRDQEDVVDAKQRATLQRNHVVPHAQGGCSRVGRRRGLQHHHPQRKTLQREVNTELLTSIERRLLVITVNRPQDYTRGSILRRSEIPKTLKC